MSPTAAWCAFGVRDPSLLSDAEGRPVVVDGRLTIFFNGRDRPLSDGGRSRVGRATAAADLSDWSVDEDPAFSDESYAAQGSVIKIAEDLHWMFYSHGTDRGFRRAASSDARCWRWDDRVLLTPGQFGCSRIGLPFVIRNDDGWLMLFEGVRRSGFALFAATSADGETWRPAAGAEPIYRPAAGRWDAGGQANPSLACLDVGDGAAGPVLLFYNGHGPGDPTGWDIGAADAADPLAGNWNAPDVPLLTRAAVGPWVSRLEGPRLVAPISDGLARLLFFTLPTRDSYAGGRIGVAEIAPAADARAIAAEAQANDRLATRYFDIWDHYPIQRYTRRVETRWIRELVQPGDAVLFAGAGGGREIEAVLDRAGRMVALDISPEMLRIGSERFAGNAIEWRLGDLHAPPPDLGAFDHIFSLGGVFNYLHDPAGAAAALYALLRPGGTLSVCVINEAHPTEGRGGLALADGRIRRAYRADEITTVLNASGGRVETLRGYRFLVDLLPKEWNTGQAGREAAALVEEAVILEERLESAMPAEAGKFLWLTSRRSDAANQRRK